MVWSIITVTTYSIIIFSLFYYYRIYQKEHRKVLTTKKIAIFSLFFSIFIVQAFITRVIPEMGELIPISFDVITTMTIGFIFGPIEGIIFGFVADFTRTLINGWTYQIIAASIFPFTGLVLGLCGRIYFKSPLSNLNIDNLNETKIIYEKKERLLLDGKTTNILVFHFFLAFFLLSSILAIKYSLETGTLPVDILFIYIYVPIVIFIMESLYFYIFIKRTKYLGLFLLLFIGVIISRVITGYIIRPYSIYFYYGSPLNLAMISRVVTSIYLIPTEVIVLFFLIMASFNSINIVYN